MKRKNIRVAWGWIKSNVHLFSIQYAKELAKIKRGKEESLQKKLQVAPIGFQQNREEFEEILNKCKLELEKVFGEEADGLIVRSRARWHEYGENSTKYFLSLEKRNDIRKHIRKLFLSVVMKKDWTLPQNIIKTCIVGKSIR